MGAKKQQKSAGATNDAEKGKNPRQPWWFNQPIPIDRFTGWLVLWTALLFIATIASTAVLVITEITFSKQLKVMQGQLDAMDANQRPWIKTEISFADDLTYGEKALHVKFHYVMKNVGRSPALNVSGYPILRPRILWPIGSNMIDLQNPIDEISKFCAKITNHIERITQSFPWGVIIYPGETNEQDMEASIDVSEIKEPPAFNSSINSFVTTTNPIMTSPILVLSCIDYQAGVHGSHHQTADYYVLSRKIRAETGNVIGQRDVDPLRRETIPKDDLVLRPSTIYSPNYAN